MATLSFPLRLIIGVTLLCSIQLPPSILAQASRDDDPYTANQEASGCPLLKAFPPLPMAVVESCHSGDSVEVVLPLKPDANGFAQEKRVRGPFEFREYRIPSANPPHAYDDLLNLVPMAGFQVKYSTKPSTITARKDDIWMLINVGEESYNVSLVHVPDKPWTVVNTAQEISSEMQTHNRVDLYGIQFSPVDQSIIESQSQILFEILTYLKQNLSLSVVIESYKVSTKGLPEDDLEITRERANAVMDWLVAHGVARTRLQPRPFGRENPLTENDSPGQIQRNERIAIAKATQ